MITIKMKVGKMMVEWQGENPKDGFKFSSLFGFLPKRCDSCQSENLALDFMKTKDGNEYYKLRCADCGAESTFGQHKEGGALFYRRDVKMEKYNPDNKKLVDNDKVPF